MKPDLLLLAPGALLLLTTMSAIDQSPSRERERRAAMRRFDALVGGWKGSGWTVSATGEKLALDVVETVQRKVGGTVLLLEGRSTTKTSDGEETVLHDGLVVLSYDHGSERYHWHGHDLHFGVMDAEPKAVEGGLEWTLLDRERHANLRFKIRVEDGSWHEIGEMLVPSGTWEPFLCVDLDRR